MQKWRKERGGGGGGGILCGVTYTVTVSVSARPIFAVVKPFDIGVGIGGGGTINCINYTPHSIFTPHPPSKITIPGTPRYHYRVLYNLIHQSCHITYTKFGRRRNKWLWSNILPERYLTTVLEEEYGAALV